jgi:hypothetical protein
VIDARWRFLFQIGIGVGAIFVAFQRKPIQKGPNNPEPFPNQRFAGSAFFVVGAAMILGGPWSLWLARH